LGANAADSPVEGWLGSLIVVVHRWLDVFFEWAMWFLIALIAIPAVTGGVALIGDRSQLVTARVWADRPVLLQAAGLANQWSNGTPSSDADALLTELVGMPALIDAESGAYILPPIRYPDGRHYLKIGIGSTADPELRSVPDLIGWFKSAGSADNRRDLRRSSPG